MVFGILSDTNNFQTVLFDLNVELLQIQPLRVRVDLGIMSMKGYSIIPRYPELEPHHQI